MPEFDTFTYIDNDRSPKQDCNVNITNQPVLPQSSESGTAKRASSSTVGPFSRYQDYVMYFVFVQKCTVIFLNIKKEKGYCDRESTLVVFIDTITHIFLAC